MKSIKTRIAAGATILGLGGLTGLALSAGHQKAPQPVAAKPLVRTKVIRRTIHVVKHVKPKHPAGAAPVGGFVETSTYGGGAAGAASVSTGSSSVGSTPSSEAAPVTTSTSGAASTPGSSTSAPVVTHASGGGGRGGGEHESERGDD